MRMVKYRGLRRIKKNEKEHRYLLQRKQMIPLLAKKTIVA
jgi:hypothetical protein